ncbi:potassium-transporting ATPase subunit C [Leptospira montravelensis]|uniref:Potassium-transporting ATPase subunit C n=1 Tax=Leptospira montravelensis TaxID=2484961 RepID=A0ABY2LVA5_9LEPT|nr:potassium-transporting ATPase subunit C [Leptospira montravelensis]TGK84154.1 potassium-transporting ATPase subunit C [Leptospira montravelensis]TGL06163.1 potassium-transporting ATPase subunit C [Leptospira montravelensis]
MKNNETSNQWEISIRFLFVSLLLLGVVYPLTVTGISNLFFSEKANGSLIILDGNVFGSELLAQKLNSKSMFMYRPSANDYNKIPSGASNLSPSSFELKTLVDQRKSVLDGMGIDYRNCPELLYASASGLDPHISVGCAYEQANFLNREFKVPIDTLNELIQKNTEYSLWGFVGRERVNVTKLNVSWKKIINE